MVGPVLHQELLLAGRRSQLHLFRWIYAAWLILQITYFSYTWLFSPAQRNSYATGDLASWFVEVYVVQQLMLLVLVTPAFAAGAITEEKTTGTLQYLLTSDLTPGQIVLGKVLARSFQVGVLALTGLPLFAFLSAFAGAEPLTLLAVVGVTVAPLFALVSASVLASVWCSQTRNAALGLYCAGLAAILAVWWFGDALSYFDPLWVLEPAWGRGGLPDIKLLAQRLVGSLFAWGLLSALAIGLSVWRLRPSYRRQLEGEGKRQKQRFWRASRPPVSDEPIKWKEQLVEGLAPAASLRRFPRWLGVLAVFAIATAASLLILWMHLGNGVKLDDLLAAVVRLDLHRLATLLNPTSNAFKWLGILIMLLASLIVGIRCSGAVSGEREKQTWEALLLTPLPAKQLIRGKLWGIMGASYVYLLACAVPTLGLSLLGVPADLAAREVPSVAWSALWLGVSVLAMYFIGASGMWCSVRCKTSWRSLLATVGIGYAGGALIYSVAAVPVAMLALLVLLFLFILSEKTGIQLFPTTASGVDQFFTVFQVLSCAGLALAAWLMALWLLSSAQKYVAYRERTLQWREEAPPRRPRRRPAYRLG